jgi:hypothetical protein
MAGEDPEQIVRERRLPKALSIALKMAAGAAAAVVLVLLLSSITALTMFD